MIETYRPTTPSRRFISTVKDPILSKDKPEKSLMVGVNRTGGRNNHGRITSRHIGGGAQKKLRLIDFKRNKLEIPAKVASIQYDPNRSAFIALLNYVDGEKRYILYPEGVKVGDTIVSGENVEVRAGNAMPLKNIPMGISVHNIELRKGKGGQMVRTAGGSATLLARDNEYCHIRLKSGEVRLVHQECMATIGEIGNKDHENVTIGKAGRMRWLGRRSCVRGVAMNPVDHPLGGGQGKTSGGRHPVSPWGQPAKGYKTRRVVHSDKFIVKKRSLKA